MRQFKVCLLSVVLVLLAVSSSRAQEVALTYQPGDTARITVTFKAPLEISSATFRFQLKGPVSPEQPNFSGDFRGSNYTKISDARYEISGVVPKNIATGDYKLLSIYISSQDTTQSYEQGRDFQAEIAIQINNSAHAEFPPIKDVTLQPHSR